MRLAQLGIEWLLALLIAAVALAIFFNGSALSTWSALHTDLSINLVAADALKHGVNPYGPTTLFDRAEALGSPTLLVYSQLFTSYIQPPTSALSLLPIADLPWRDATRVYLVLNHVFVFAAVGVMLLAIRPTVPVRWVIAGVALLVMLYSQIYASFALGQVDAILALLLAIGFWGYSHEKPVVAGAAVACGVAIKIVPALLLLYFLWRRDYKSFAWSLGIGLVLLVVSAAYIGPDIYKSYLTETVPALMKGSSHYANASFGALIARANTPDFVFTPFFPNGLPEMINLNETTLSTGWRVLNAAVSIAVVAGVALVLGWRKLASPRDPGRLLPEYYLVITAGLIISSVTWEFYVIWLLPAFVAVFLAPRRVLPWQATPRLLFLVAFAAAFVALNYPGDFYLFGDNGWFYHPEWVPGTWVEKRIWLYHSHIDAVVYLRLGALAFTAASFSGLVLWWRLAVARAPSRARPDLSQALPQAVPVEGSNSAAG